MDKIKRIELLSLFECISDLSRQPVNIDLGLKIIKLMDFYMKVKKESDEFSIKINEEIKDYEEIGKKVNEFLNESIDIIKEININDLKKSDIKISANRLSELLILINR